MLMFHNSFVFNFVSKYPIKTIVQFHCEQQRNEARDVKEHKL